jgi:hypothetical protein
MALKQISVFFYFANDVLEEGKMGRRLTNEEFIARLLIKNKHYANGNFVLNEEYRGRDEKISCHCNIHNGDWSTFAKILTVGSGCPYCSGNSVLIGFNDLWTTRPDVAKLLKNQEDGYNYSYGSNAMVEFVCPQCGSMAKKKIVDVCNQGLGCQICSDGVSYPNKLIRQVLTQLNVDFISEYSPDWIKPRKYDCYFEYCGGKYVVEMDGRQHFYNSFSQGALEDIQRSDEVKNYLAIKNGICVIRIDCIKSDCDYIKNNILSSKLNNIFDLSGIDWNLCDRAAQKSLVKDACDVYMSGVDNLMDICDMLHICIATVRNYLKIGAECGLCNYDPQESRRQLYASKSIPIILINDSGNIIYNFNGLNDCVRRMQELFHVKMNKTSVKQHCKTHKPYKGFNFRFANETIQN